MQFKALTLFALSAAAQVVKDEKRQESSSSIDINSVASVLLTAMPASLLSIAATNTAAVSALVRSEFDDGQAPDWFTRLPSDAQSFLLASETLSTTASPRITTGSGTNNSVTGFMTNSSSVSAAQSSIAASNSSANSAASTSNRLTTASTRSDAASTAASTAGSSGTSSGMAALPTAMIGSGLVGALGILGMLAL